VLALSCWRTRRFTTLNRAWAFSWDPMHDGKTTVSGGFGIFDVLPLPYLFQMNELFSAPFLRIRERKELACRDLPGCGIRSAYCVD